MKNEVIRVENFKESTGCIIGTRALVQLPEGGLAKITLYDFHLTRDEFQQLLDNGYKGDRVQEISFNNKLGDIQQ